MVQAPLTIELQVKTHGCNFDFYAKLEALCSQVYRPWGQGVKRVLEESMML